MKVFWISNVPVSPTQSRGSGGWLTELFNELEKRGLTLFAAHPKSRGSHDCHGGVVCPFRPIFRRSQIERAQNDFAKMFRSTAPDIIHIHGTEMLHSYAALCAAKECNIPVVVSIQGIVGEIAKHTLTGVPKQIVRRRTLRDAFCQTHPNGLRRKYESIGNFEKAIAQSADLLLGRTQWDRAWAYFYAPLTPYRSIYEPLRRDFYQTNSQWDYRNCEKNLVFVSQSSGPIKGFLQLAEALTLVRTKIPSVRVMVAGKHHFNADWRSTIVRTGYESHVRKFLHRNNLLGSLQFLGPQSTEEVIANLLACNVYVQPSLIENSPNALAEACYLGVPSVASFVGGVPSMYQDYPYISLYQSDSSLMLADAIVRTLNASQGISPGSLQWRQRRKFDLAQIVDDVIAAYSSLSI